MKVVEHAMDQTEVVSERSRLEDQSTEVAQQIAELQARQAKVERTLSRINVQTALLGERAVPRYAPWLPFSSNGKSEADE